MCLSRSPPPPHPPTLTQDINPDTFAQMSPPVSSSVRMTFLGQVSVLGSGVDCTAVLADVVGDKVGSVGSVRAATVTGRWDRADRQWAAWDAAQQGKTCRFQAVRQKHTKRNSRKESKGDMAKAAKSRDKVRRFDRQLKDAFVRGEDVPYWETTYHWDWWEDGSEYADYTCFSDYDYNYDNYCECCQDRDTRRKKRKKRKQPTVDAILLTPCPLRKRVTLSAMEKRKTQKTRRPKYVTRQAKERQTLHLARQKVHKARSRIRSAARQDKNAFLVEDLDVDVDQEAGCRREGATARRCRVRTLAAGTPTVNSVGYSAARISIQGTYVQVWPGEVLWEDLWASEIVLPEEAAVEEVRVVQTRKAVEVAKTPKTERRTTCEQYAQRGYKHTMHLWRQHHGFLRFPIDKWHAHQRNIVPMSVTVKSVTYVDVSRCGKGASHPTLTAARQAEAASVRKAALAHKVKVPKADVVVAEEEEEKEEKLMQKAIRHHLCTSAAQRKAPRRRRAKTARSSVLAATILEVLYH